MNLAHSSSQSHPHRQPQEYQRDHSHGHTQRYTSKTLSQPVSTLVKKLFKRAQPFGLSLAISTLSRVAGNVIRVAFFVLMIEAIVHADSNFIWTMLALAVLKAIASYCEHFAGHWVAFSALASLRTQLYRCLGPQAPGLGARVQSGNVANLAVRDIDKIEVFYAHTLVPLASTLITIPLLGYFSSYISWQTGITISVWMCISALVIPWFRAHSAIRNTQVSARYQGAAAADVANYVAALPLGLLLPGFDTVAERIYDRTTTSYQELANAMRADSKRVALGWITDICGALAAAIVAVTTVNSGNPWIVGTDTVPQPVIAGGLAAVIVLSSIVFASSLRDVAPDLLVAFASAERLFALMDGRHRRAALATGASLLGDTPTSDSDVSPHRITIAQMGATVIEGIIESLVDEDKQLFQHSGAQVDIVDVTYTYSRRREIGPINLSVPAGSHLVIYGPSGCGKSTICGLVSSALRPTSGAVLIDGQDIWSKNSVDPVDMVTVIEQSPHIFATSIRENLLLANAAATDEQMRQALAAVGLDSFVDNHGGLDQRIGERGTSLSGGQRQRLGLARALLRNTPIYLLDEVGANLDEQTYRETRENVLKALRGATIIEISHRLGE